MGILNSIIWVKGILGLLALGFSSHVLFAYASMNTRPVAVSSSGLQTELNTIFGCSGCVNSKTNQSPEGLWQTSTAQNPTATAVLQLTDLPGTDTFGIWTNSNQLVPIMYGSAEPTDPYGFSTSATLQWSPTGALRISDPSGSCTYIDCTTVTDISASSFGFYLKTGTGSVYYTLDSLNPSGAAQALTYNYSNEWVLAFNDTAVTPTSPGSYTDFVVGIQSISGLPEPSSLLLLGTTLLIVALQRRRLLRRRTNN